MKPVSVLFVLKKRGEPYNPHHPPHPPHPQGWPHTSTTGLRNSVAFVTDMLQTLGIEACSEEARDDNDIDRVVTQHRPTHVIIEALWARPSKIEQLARLHRNVLWNVRLHSEVPFIANEGIAAEWLFGYLQAPHTSVSTNSLRAQADFQGMLGEPILYAPNYYPLYPLEPRKGLPADNVIDVGCFGAIRPLKNQFAQAVAAIAWADQMQASIRYHINADRIEMNGAQTLKNLRALFANIPRHKLVEHPWLDRAEFMALVRTMDIGLQVSFSETFNIVSADFAFSNVPLVVSPEVAWVARVFHADPTSVSDMVLKMHVAWAGRQGDLQKLNYQGLQTFDAASEIAWPKALMGMS